MANPLRGAATLGFAPFGPAASTTQLNAAATWLAFSFLAPPGSKTVNKVRVFISAVAGTLGTTDLTCDVYSDTPGNPNASLGSVSLGSAPVAAGWVEFTGLSVATTAGTQYWIVLKNANGTPASNNATFRYLTSSLPNAVSSKSISNKSGPNCVDTTANSGVAWSNANNSVAGYRIGYSDSSYDGLAFSNVAVGADLAFGSNEVGVKFTTPAGPTLNVAGVAFQLEAVGSPTGNVRFRLYNGTTLLGTTANLVCNIPTATTGDWFYCYFATPVALPPSTVCRASFCESAADSSSNCFKTGNDITADTDANSLALLPFGGTLQKSTYNGSAWTDTNSSVIPFALLLDAAGEYTVAASGGNRVIGG